jgi:hypothetical protein
MPRRKIRRRKDLLPDRRLASAHVIHICPVLRSAASVALSRSVVLLVWCVLGAWVHSTPMLASTRVARHACEGV